MKFKEGEKVQFLGSNTKQSRTRFPGEIVSANGDICTIRYQLFLNAEGEPFVEKASLRNIRPQPPPIKEEDNWALALGDMVEVFDHHCWKVGKVVKMLKNGRFVVELCGQIQLKEFQKSCLRVQQAWQTRKWIVINKAAARKKSNWKRNYDGNAPSKCYMHFGGESSDKTQHPPKRIFLKRKHKHLDKLSPHTKTMKRNYNSDFQLYVVDAVGEIGGGMKRGILDVVRREQVLINSLKQVDNISSNKAYVVKSKRCISRSSEVDVHIERLNNHDPFSMAVQVTEASSECSIGSCSGSNFLDCATQNSWELCGDVSCGYFDDAESTFSPNTPGSKHLPPSHGNEVDYNVHELEVHAYRKTMQALYATGPLSWDQESLLTDLRLTLNISTDEHLLHLKQLFSSQML